jgi:hypothetical protein
LVKQKESFKVNLEKNEDAVIFSTVHASKGLESPIVFLLNASKALSAEDDKENLFFSKEDNLFLLSKKRFFCKKWEELRERKKSEKYAEYIRLFYVALTRAREELYIFPEKEAKEKDFASWYEIAKQNLPENKIIFGDVKQGSHLVKKIEKEKVFVPNLSLPSFIQKRERATEKAFENRALLLGTALHDILANGKTGVELSDVETSDIYNLAQKIQDKFPFLFSQNSYSEVEIMQEMEEDTIFFGRIDRLIIGESVDIYDFKFQKIPFLLEKTKHQLAKYKQALSKIYPHKEIKCFAVWVKELEIEEINHFSSQKDESYPQLF